MNKYLKHQKMLQSKRESKHRVKLASQSRDILSDASVSQDNIGSLDGSQRSGAGDSDSIVLDSVSQQEVMLDDVVRGLESNIDSRFLSLRDELKDDLASSLKNDLTSTLQEQMSMLFEQLSNKFLSAPHQVPVDMSHGK